MTKPIKPKKPTKAELKRKLVEMEAQLASTYHFADADIGKASIDKMMVSGVLITMHALGGREIIPPVVIKDGLSNETITALRKDLVRSFMKATMFRPAGVAPVTTAELDVAIPTPAPLVGKI